MSAAKYQEDEFGKREGTDNGSPIPDITAEEFRDHIVYIRRALSDLNTALAGNDLGTEGVIPRLKNVETVTAEHEKVYPLIPPLVARVDKHDKQFLVWGAYITALCAGLGIFAKLFGFL